MERRKITVTYEIEISDRVSNIDHERIEATVRDKALSLGYGANQFWRLDPDTIVVKVAKPWW